MRKLKTAVTVTAFTVAAIVLAACGSSGGAPPVEAGSTGSPAADGTFTFSVADDPGDLNPLLGSRTVAVNLFRFLYDPLVHADPDGKIVSGLASDWKVDGGTVTFTIKKGVTCSDGTPITPKTIETAFNNIKNPDNKSTLVGIALPDNKFTVSSDDAAGTFTLKLAQPYQFILPALEFLPIPCGKAAEQPGGLSAAASGSGPYTLSEVVPSDHYTLTRRDGYSWGPAGATTAEPGLPSKIVMKIVSSETTAANLLTTGELNAAAIAGTDRQRLMSAEMKQNTYTSGGAMLVFNQQDGRPTKDPSVRKAIVMALNRDQIASVLTQGLSEKASSSVAPASPQSCVDTDAASAIPTTDVEAAKKLLDEAGWKPGADGIREKDGKKLELVAPLLSTYAGNQPAAELMNQQLTPIGVKLTLTPLTQGTLSTTLFSTGDYDLWPTLALSIPFQSGVFGLLGGPPPPNGTNAGHVANATFTETATKANQTVGADGCKLWIEAEKALFANADVAPIAGVMTNWITTKSSFEVMQGRIIPTSIRLTN